MNGLFLELIAPRDLSDLQKMREAHRAAARYEVLRKLNPAQFKEIYEQNIKTGVPFDDLIDRLTKE